jgi:hypothetical protein
MLGRALENGTREFESFVAQHDVKTIPGTRSIIIVDIHQVGTSCGFSVPYYEFKGHREILNEGMKRRDDKFKAGLSKESIPRYWAFKNAFSMDHMPAMKQAIELGRKEHIKPMKKMVGPFAPVTDYKIPQGVSVEVAVMIAVVSLIIGALLALYGKSAVAPVGGFKIPVVNTSSIALDGVLKKLHGI